MHTPVFLEEAIEGLNIKPGGLYIDGTYGEGGHTNQIVLRGGKVLAIDLDATQLKKAPKQEGIELVQGNYANIAEIALAHNFSSVDGVLLDFGLSMGQISNSKRGFSYKNIDEPLDMRLSLELEDTAADFINTSNREQLADLLVRNSEEINAKPIANAIKSADRVKTVGDLVKVIPGGESVVKRVFQALRIAVNHEFENIQAGLKGAFSITKPGGRIVVISFHSLEDRMVKQWGKANGLQELFKKHTGEQKFERSAVIRVYQKI